MGWFKIHYWPILTAVWFTLTYIISYILALSQGHVTCLFPYISDTGTTSPESCVFGQMLNIAAVFLYITLFIRYEQVKLILQNTTSNKLKKCNCFSNGCGIFIALGVSLVGNFQETNVLVVHLIGASLAFGVASAYAIIQTWITWQTDASASKFIKYSRLVFCIPMVPLFFAINGFGAGSFYYFEGENFLMWKKDDGGYSFHLISTFSEWTLGFILNVFILTFVHEFKYVEFESFGFKSTRRVE